MTVCLSSYNTRFGSSLVVDKTVRAIQESLIRDNLAESNLGYGNDKVRCVFVTGMNSSESNIPHFFHPIVIEEKNKGVTYVVSDIRPFITLPEYGSADETFKVRNKTEYQFVVNRTVLQMNWLDRAATQLKASLPAAGAVYAGWISEAISKRYSLDPKDRLLLSIIAHFYYQSQFDTDSSVEEDTKQKFSVHTIKATNAPAALVFQVFDQIKVMNTPEDFCRAVSNVLENIRLKDFSYAMLVTIISQAWYGLNAADTLAIALEHPPTWISIVQTALTDRTFKNSLIARIAEKVAKSSVVYEFNMTCIQILKDCHTLATEHIATEELVFNKFD